MTLCFVNFAFCITGCLKYEQKGSKLRVNTKRHPVAVLTFELNPIKVVCCLK